MPDSTTFPFETWFAEGQSECREATVSLSEYTEFVLERVARAGESVTAYHVDLFLACACSHGDKAALDHFSRRFLPHIARAFAKMSIPKALADEATQMLVCKILYGENGKPPKITEYSGVGPLDAWVRVAALRVAFNQNRSERRAFLLESPLSDPRNPELDALKAEHREFFEDAFREAIATLSRAELSLLRAHVLSGENLEQIAKDRNVSKRTISRWIANVRETVVTETRRRVTAKVMLNDREFESLIRLLMSQIELELVS